MNDAYHSYEPEIEPASLWMTPVDSGNYGETQIRAPSRRTTVRASVDSGAVVTAIPLSIAPDYPALMDDTCGTEYRSATGAKIRDLGQKRLLFRHGGALKGVKGRSMDVKKMLVSVYDLCATGHKVIFEFGQEGSYALHRESGEVTKFDLIGKTWELAMDLVPHSDVRSASGAHRQLCPLAGRA